MKRFSTMHVLVALACFLASCPKASAQPNPSLWNEVYNPSGERVVPDIFYEVVTGELVMDTRGLNGTVESPDYPLAAGGPIVADDVGMVAMLVESDYAYGRPGIGFGGGLVFSPGWLAFSALYFAGKYQSIGITLGPTASQFVRPGIHAVWNLVPGLDAANFGTVEMSVNFEPLRPGTVLFCEQNCVRIVPEPMFGIPAGMLCIRMAQQRLTPRRRAPMRR